MKHREKQLTRYQNTMETTMEIRGQRSIYFIFYRGEFKQIKRFCSFIVMELLKTRRSFQ